MVVIDLIGIQALHIVLDLVAYHDLIAALKQENEGRRLLQLLLQVLVKPDALGGILLLDGGQCFVGQIRNDPAGLPGNRVGGIVLVDGKGTGIRMRVELVWNPVA